MLNKIPSQADEAAVWHRLLPQTTRKSLHAFGITDAVIDRLLVGWSGTELTVPVEDASGHITHVARIAPTDLRSLDSSSVYGWDTIRRHPSRVILCESIGDRLLLESRGFPAVAVGKEVLPLDLAAALQNVPDVFVCLPQRETKNALPIGNIHFVALPEAVRENRRLFDYFVCQGYGVKAFERLLIRSRSARWRGVGNHARTARARRLLPIENVIGKYTKLEARGNDLVGRCPLHRGQKLSLSVYPEAQTFHCFECDADGDALSFLMEAEGLTEGQAVERLEAIAYEDESKT
jgi:hypothetical protein